MKLVDIFEARRNPSQNSKIPPLAQLEHIKKQFPNNKLFVTFTAYNKFGINPSSRFNTPLGLYAYPLEYVIAQSMDVPYAKKQPYIQVFTVTDDSNLWYLNDKNHTLQIFNRWRGTAGTDVPSDSVEYGSDLFYKIYRTVIKHKESVRESNVGIEARKEFVKLGISGIVDLGSGTIHENEPTQAVFFDLKILKIVSVIDNSTFDIRKHSDKIRTGFVDAGCYDMIDVAKLKGKSSYSQIMKAILQKQDPKCAYSFARHVLHRRWTEAEPLIMSDPRVAVEYASGVIKDRWPEAEPFILNGSLKASCFYARDLIHGEWPALEDKLLKPNNEVDPVDIAGTIVFYARFVRPNEDRWLAAEPILLKMGDPISIYQYIRYIRHQPWPEAELILKQNSAVYDDYISTYKKKA